MVYSTRRFVVCFSVCHFVLVFFSPFSIAITSLGEERANLSAFRTFVRFVLVWICHFPLPLGVWEGLRFVTVALPGLFSYLFYTVKLWFTWVYIILLISTQKHRLWVLVRFFFFIKLVNHTSTMLYTCANIQSESLLVSGHEGLKYFYHTYIGMTAFFGTIIFTYLL